MYAGRAAQAFEPGAESSLARGASHLGASDLHIRLEHIENGDKRYEFSSDEVPGRAWDRQCARHVRNKRIVRAAEYQLHPSLRQFGCANGAVLLTDSSCSRARLQSAWLQTELGFQTSVLIPKFASLHGTLVCERRNQKGH